MKLKMTECNGIMSLLVLGERQDIIITEENGWFALELLNKDNNALLPFNIQEKCHVVDPLLPVLEKEDSEEDLKDATLKAEQDDALFKKMATLRKSLAAEENVPPYIIFHDKTLREMINKMPVDIQAMGHISGVGQAKLEKYGPAFLDIIKGVV